MPFRTALLPGHLTTPGKLEAKLRHALHLVKPWLQGDGPTVEEVADRWILGRLSATQTTVEESLEACEFAGACRALDDFVRRDVCDWYLEMVKPDGPTHRDTVYRVFDTALDFAEQTRVHLAADIRGAAARGELELHYQARVRPDDLKIAGAEALVRWHHPQRGLIGPDDFIHIAEETGAIHEIGEWVIESAAAQVGYWRRSIGTLVPVSVNVSPKQFQSGVLVEHVLGLGE